MKEIKVSVKGITPLLMNRFRDTALEGKSKKVTGARTEMPIEDKLYLYEGKPHIPAIYFRNSLVEASKQFKITGKGKSTYSRLIGATIDITPEFISIKPEKYDTYRVAAVNPMTKGRMMISRPRFTEWEASFNIIINDDSVPVDVINEVLEQAGRYVGIGDWRPEKKGMHGKFMITSFQVK